MKTQRADLKGVYKLAIPGISLQVCYSRYQFYWTEVAIHVHAAARKSTVHTPLCKLNKMDRKDVLTQGISVKEQIALQRLLQNRFLTNLTDFVPNFTR